MSILRYATDQTQSDWIPVPEGLWRWVIGKPELKLSEKFGNYQVRFPLVLHPDEQKRLAAEYEKPAEGMQQSWRVSYTVGLSMGYVQKDGQYKSTKLIDFLSAVLGKEQIKKFRDWIAGGGGPPRPEDKNDQKAELEIIAEWLTWWENLEVYGTITHADDSQQAGVVWARFAGPMAVGSLPGQKDPEYQAHGRAKLRAIIVQSHPELAEDKPAQQFTAEGKQVAGDGSDDLPF